MGKSPSSAPPKRLMTLQGICTTHYAHETIGAWVQVPVGSHLSCCLGLIMQSRACMQQLLARWPKQTVHAQDHSQNAWMQAHLSLSLGASRL